MSGARCIMRLQRVGRSRMSGVLRLRSPLVSQAFLKGTCRFGEECRFSHDTATFLAEKPADLPGSCPFASVPTGCPFGLTCRYYGAHDNPAAAKVRHRVCAAVSDR